MGTTFNYDENAAGHADDFTNRLDTSGAYVGQFKRAEFIKSGRTGTEGVRFEFDSPGVGATQFDIYTVKSDGTTLKGFNQVMAMMTVFGLRGGLSSVPGKVQSWDNGQKVEVEGEVYEQLIGKDIGLVLQREDYSGQDGKDRYRMNLVGIFRAKDKLMASEIRERKTEPAKLARALRGLKDVDNRTPKEAEPAQPAAGPAGDY